MGIVDDIRNAAEDAAEAAGLEDEVDRAEDAVQEATGVDLGGSGGGSNADDVQNQGSSDAGVSDPDGGTSGDSATGADAFNDSGAGSGPSDSGFGGTDFDSGGSDFEDDDDDDGSDGNQGGGQTADSSNLGDSITGESPGVASKEELQQKTKEKQEDKQRRAEKLQKQFLRTDQKINRTEAAKLLTARGVEAGKEQFNALTQGKPFPREEEQLQATKTNVNDRALTNERLRRIGGFSQGEAEILFKGGSQSALQESAEAEGKKIAGTPGKFGAALAAESFDSALIASQIGTLAQATAENPESVKKIPERTVQGFKNQADQLASKEGVVTEAAPEAVGLIFGSTVSVNAARSTGNDLAPGLVSGKLGSKVTRESVVQKPTSKSSAQAQQVAENQLVKSKTKKEVKNNVGEKEEALNPSLARGDLRRNPKSKKGNTRVRKKVQVGEDSVTVGIREEKPISRTEFLKDRLKEAASKTDFPTRRKGELSLSKSKSTGKNVEPDTSATGKQETIDPDDFFDSDTSKAETTNVQGGVTGFKFTGEVGSRPGKADKPDERKRTEDNRFGEERRGEEQDLASGQEFADNFATEFVQQRQVQKQRQRIQTTSTQQTTSREATKTRGFDFDVQVAENRKPRKRPDSSRGTADSSNREKLRPDLISANLAFAAGQENPEFVEGTGNSSLNIRGALTKSEASGKTQSFFSGSIDVDFGGEN